MRTLILTVLCLLLAGTALAAERTAVATPVTGDALSFTPSGAAGVCTMGNLNPPAYYIGDWIWGAESYKYLFDAEQPLCSTCNGGFKVETVHFYMQFGVEDVPVTFGCAVDFEETIWDEATQCFLPGPVICESPGYTVTIDQAGMYDIALPLPTDCACAYFGYKYALGMNILTAFDSYPGAVTDATPVGCTSFNNYGAGWFDLLDFGFPGELIMFGDIVCCENPVDDQNDTWGGVKSLFR
ncbi:hypothetical protein COW53_00215 [bacterium CG17_big_fil_post_rev_8_21_14_2_50_64_8]|nr:MAG: hypothetical protein COW53_00215 [bacterium CG17_big_fil_post_rev_8_21_14_2_50_64_8]PJA76422.1 MAG: hypothetical protein CO151_02875 [bacterium CG_4_9_14_3_um_filter_65_15]